MVGVIMIFRTKALIHVLTEEQMVLKKRRQIVGSSFFPVFF